MMYTDIKGLRISKLTFGTVALGIEYGMFNGQRKPDHEQGQAILRLAASRGINTFDTAREYGCAEDLLGEVFEHEKSGKDVNLITKFKVTAESLSCFDQAKDEAYASVRASMHALGVKQLPICLFHMVSSFDMEKVMDSVPLILRQLKRDGLIQLGGISVDHPLEAKCCVNQPDIEAVQVPLNVFDQRLVSAHVLADLQALNKIVLVRSVFLKGLFFRSPEELQGNLVDAGRYLTHLKEFAARSGMGVAQFVFSYVRDMVGVTSLVFGAETERQVQETVALLKGPKIPLAIRNEVEVFFEQVPELILTPRMWTN